MGDRVGIVVRENDGLILRCIVPEDDGELDLACHQQPGEKMIVIHKSVLAGVRPEFFVELNKAKLMKQPHLFKLIG